MKPGLQSMFIGRSNDYIVTVNKGLNGSNDKSLATIYENKNRNKLVTVNYKRFTMSKEFTAITIERKKKPSSILFIFEEEGSKLYFEMFNNGRNVFTNDPIHLKLKYEEEKSIYTKVLDKDF